MFNRFVWLMLPLTLLSGSLTIQQQPLPTGTATASAVITVENAPQLREVAHWQGDARLISQVVFSSDGSQLAVVGGRGLIDNGEVTFLNPKTLEAVSLTNDKLIATRVAFSPDGTLFVTANEAGQITLYQFQSFKSIMTIQGANGRILSIAVDPLDHFLAATFGSVATGMEANTIFQVFSLPSGTEYMSMKCPNLNESSCDGPYGSAVTFDTGGHTVFLATSDGVVHSWNLETKQENLISDNYSLLSHDLISVEDGLDYIIQKGSVRLLSSDSHYDDLTVPPIDEAEPEFPYALALLPTEPILAVAYGRNIQGKPNRDAVLRLWDIDHLKVIATIEISTPEDDPIFSLEFSPDGTLLATGSGDGTVRLWGVPAGG